MASTYITVKRLATAIDRHMKSTDMSKGLTTIQSTILGYILARHGEEIFANKIEKEFCLSHPTVISILKKLEADGLIETKRLPTDRRFKAISATPKSLAHFEAVQPLLDNIESRMLNNLSADECAQVEQIMKKMCDNLG